MLYILEKRLRQAVREHLERRYSGLENLELVVEIPPQPELGDFALPLCFTLAKHLRQAPRAIAQEWVRHFVLPEGFTRLELAGAGYLNFFLDRAKLARQALGEIAAAPRPCSPQLAARLNGKVIVEHTNINPNKAAHVGHLRNAVLGDTWARLLRYRGEQVEVQNYIDNTGVQVADVVAGIEHSNEIGFRYAWNDIEAILEPIEIGGSDSIPAIREKSFDYLCWDLYSLISKYFQEHPEALAWRQHAIQSMEHDPAGHSFGMPSHKAGLISKAIVTAHLRTMQRLKIQYDVLPRESEILSLHFWNRAFDLLRESGAVYRSETIKNKGCWVMAQSDAAAPTESEVHASGEDKADENQEKVIVRSDGTVTYVGKDIAYQLWKFGLLGLEFQYREFEAAGLNYRPWVTTHEGGQPMPFGHATAVYNVIDSRQSYLQNIVSQALRALGHAQAAERSFHFSYEMVGLTPRCAEQLGFSLTAEEKARPHVEVSGRKGLGVKADDLMDRLIQAELPEIELRNPGLAKESQIAAAEQIAMGALRYFLLKFTRNAVIAFDFKDALSFEGETGPYIQYAAVRAGKILDKAGYSSVNPLTKNMTESAAGFFTEDEFWLLLHHALRLDSVVEQCILSQEPAHLAKYAFGLAQAFNNFYHRHPVVQEADPDRKVMLLRLVAQCRATLTQALDLMGMTVPAVM